eukprot:TRINITY_DN8620_c1_g1_i1.p1 TRINITY_DN8620_c1_g1~~TRINITY_DN8620_c1_g1_i1.p1  ORF type:complete len:143 (+),score=30.07 TRINITY_DN8620_c1_g1_i1:105-533(+)
MHQKRISAEVGFEERIQELETRLVALDRELQRQKSGAGQGNLDVLQKAKEALVKVNAENSSLYMRLKEIEKRRKEEEEDHVAEVEGYEEAIREKNEAIRDLSEKVKLSRENKHHQPFLECYVAMQIYQYLDSLLFCLWSKVL